MGVKQYVKNTLVSWMANDLKSEEKAWDDTLVAIRDGNREEWGKVGIQNPYAQNHVIHRAIDVMSQNIAQVPLLLYNETSGQSMPVGHDFYKLMRRPNPFTSQFELWEQTLIYFFLYGEAFWYFNVNEFGFIREIYALHPQFMKHVQKDLSSPISGWIYNEKVPMQVNEVVQFKMFATGGVRGLSPLQAIKLEYGADADAAKFNKKFFENGTRVSGVISVDKDRPTTIQEMRKVLTQWKQAHQGANNAYSVGALLNGMKYNEFGMTMRDMEFIEGRDAIRDRILLLYGVHKSIVGVSDKIDRATAEAALRSLWSLTLKPQTVRFEQKLNAELFDIYFPGISCKFDLTVVEELKKDLTTTISAAKELMQMGYTRNEVNFRLGLRMPESDEDGDTRYMPLQLVPVDANPLIIQAEANAENAGKEVSTLVNKNLENFLRVQKNAARAFTKKMKGYAALQRGKVLKSLLRSPETFETNLDRLFTREDARLEKAITPFYVAAALEAVTLIYDTIGSDKTPAVDTTEAKPLAVGLKSFNRAVKNEIKVAIVGIKDKDAMSEAVKQVYESINIKLVGDNQTKNIMETITYKILKEEGIEPSKWLNVN